MKREWNMHEESDLELYCRRVSQSILTILTESVQNYEQKHGVIMEQQQPLKSDNSEPSAVAPSTK